MDDPVLYVNFLTNVAGVTVARAQNELLTFANTFCTLLSSNEKELEKFVKDTHASNSARANNARILIPTRSVIALKAILFELKDHERCDALLTAAMLQALNANQMNQLRARRNQAKQDESHALLFLVLRKLNRVEITLVK